MTKWCNSRDKLEYNILNDNIRAAGYGAISAQIWSSMSLWAGPRNAVLMTTFIVMISLKNSLDRIRL